MNAVAGLLDGPRAREAFLLRSRLDPPWAFRVADEAPLTVVALARGVAWVLPEHGPPVRAGAGDILICRGPDTYVMADDPATPPDVAIGPDQQCRPLRTGGRQLAESLGCEVRTWGNADPGTTVMLTGTYPCAARSPNGCCAHCRRSCTSTPTPGTRRSSRCWPHSTLWPFRSMRAKRR
jgi:hypothetical protein